MKKLSIEQLLKVLEAKKYKVFDKQLNIIGVRHQDKKNMFDDELYMFYKDGDKIQTLYYFDYFTTDPGFKSLLVAENPKGCAIVAPGQYLDLWKVGLHRGQYKALVQVGNVNVYRDNDRDKELDMVNIERGIFGINLHRANAKMRSIYVENWSAGCQVHGDPTEFDTCMKIIEMYKTAKGTYHYTLLEAKDTEVGGK